MKLVLKIVNGKHYYTAEFREHKIVIFQSEDRWFYIIYNDTGVVYNSKNHSKGFLYWQIAQKDCYKWFRKNLKNLKTPLRKKGKVMVYK